MLKYPTLLVRCFIIILLSTALSMFAIYSLTLTEPVFLENHLELYRSRNDKDGSFREDYELYKFGIQYITNKNDKRYVTDIVFTEFPTLDLEVYEVPDHSRPHTMSLDYRMRSYGTRGRYTVRSLAVYIERYEETLDTIALSKAIIFYSDGSEQEVLLGEILLTAPATMEEKTKSHTAGYSSQSGVFSSTFASGQGIVLDRVSSPLLEQSSEEISLSINGIDYREIKGVTIGPGVAVTVEVIFNTDKLLSKYNQYELRPIIFYDDVEGNRHGNLVEELAYQPYYRTRYHFIDLVRYLHRKGAV